MQSGVEIPGDIPRTISSKKIVHSNKRVRRRQCKRSPAECYVDESIDYWTTCSNTGPINCTAHSDMLGIELSLDTSRIIGDIRTTTLNKALARKFIVLDYVREAPTTLIGMYIL